GWRPRFHGASLESDRLRMVRRFSGRDCGAAERRVDRDLRAQLCDGSFGLVACPPRDVLASPGFGGPAFIPGNRSRPVDPCTKCIGCHPTGDRTNLGYGDLVADCSAVDSSIDEVAAT